jgi:uncharacterized protein (DUF983 family)
MAKQLALSCRMLDQILRGFSYQCPKCQKLVPYDPEQLICASTPVCLHCGAAERKDNEDIEA